MSGTTPRRSRPGGGALTKKIPTTNWATSSVGSESAPHFNMSLWSWVRALTEAKEKGMGHAPIACEWDHPSSEWARGWGGALTTGLLAQLVVRVLPISICPFGLGFELSRRRKKRAWDMPL